MMKNRIPTSSFATVRKCQKRVPVVPDKFKTQVMAWPRSAEALVHLKSLGLKTTELHEFIFEGDAKLEVPVTSWGIVNKDGAIRSEDGTYVTVGKKAEPKHNTPADAGIAAAKQDAGAKAAKPKDVKEKAEPKPKEVKEKAEPTKAEEPKRTHKKKVEPKPEETKS